MVSIGVWKGMNLDGGGSTTMITRPFGEMNTGLAFATEYGTEQRAVINGLGVYSLAPQGQLKGLTISGTSSMLVGQEGTYSLKGYDTYYNPYDMSGASVTWKSSNGNVISTSGGKITATGGGTATLTAVSGSASAKMQITVVGASNLKSLKAGAGTGSLQKERPLLFRLPQRPKMDNPSPCRQTA